MSAIPAVEVLAAVLDLYSQAVVYSFTTGTELDQTFTLTGATTAVQGRDYGYNALGTSARPMATRTTTWHVFHKYGVNENWDTLKDAMMLAFGHGRPVYLQKARADGTLLIAEAVLSSFPDHITADSRFKAEFPIVFEMRGDWMAQAVAQPRYDTGLTYDSGQHYDSQGQLVPATGGTTSFDLTNNGTIAEKAAFLQFNGPMTGPITLVNYSCDVRGVPFAHGPPGAPMYLQLYVNLASGEYLSINCQTGMILTNQANTVAWAQVVKAPGQRSYWELPPGLSHCQLTKGDAAAAGSLLIVFRSKYR